ncbi:MAG: malto-oligosyltrehalose synthase [Actinobacteria bacterium]|nr:MAG: malto-oligosyltrehalose synthase [Actinomycetota bacterium]
MTSRPLRGAVGQTLSAPFRATYRLQLGTDLDLRAARELLPYLDDLGISHVYLSPIWQARAGSTHGYDVIDPAAIARELGGEEELRALSSEARARGMGLILDVVPNHMAADDANAFWADPELRRRFFDVDEITGRWRRFFDIDELAGVRQEDPEVFEATHRLVLALVAEGVVDGLRIDHPDGLADPAGYLQRLAARGAEHVWVEKILDPDEHLRDWLVEGTVGYEFANDLVALFCDPAAEPVFEELWGGEPFGALAADAKLEQAQTTFAPEIGRLRRIADLPRLAESVAALPVYRTYVRDGDATAEDRAALAGCEPAVREEVLAGGPFATRFQQTTPAVMAKGVEDTAFYRHTRFLPLNEVGGDPSRWSISVDDFHAGNAERARRFPRGLLVSTTHDTKRSGDVRARLLGLTAMAADWAGAVRSWHEVNAKLSASVPWGEELLVYQTLLGAWPISRERLEPYLVKALRERKLTSTWIDPDLDHEARVNAFAVGLFDHGPFRYGFDGIVARASELGERIALAQTVLKLTSPGMPDVYQGDELWALSLVDPDNRRPVDWAARRVALDALRGGEPATRETAKLHIIWSVLHLRRRRPDQFAGAYTPIPAGDDVCAFLRGDDVLVAVAVRERWRADPWSLPSGMEGAWRDVLTGAEFELPAHASAPGVLGPEGRAVLERLD